MQGQRQANHIPAEFLTVFPSKPEMVHPYKMPCPAATVDSSSIVEPCCGGNADIKNELRRFIHSRWGSDFKVDETLARHDVLTVIQSVLPEWGVTFTELSLNLKEVPARNKGVSIAGLLLGQHSGELTSPEYPFLSGPVFLVMYCKITISSSQLNEMGLVSPGPHHETSCMYAIKTGCRHGVITRERLFTWVAYCMMDFMYEANSYRTTSRRSSPISLLNRLRLLSVVAPMSAAGAPKPQEFVVYPRFLLMS
ncbi:hypothetical protein HGRIS_013601 [Hohenbuehelia grisea]|uniref:Uncharacterized protein n=1 Tax=Hohenbuehelia grisea TaxID=104357 RepID=A0ABR3IWB0_9AGAR